MALLRRSGLCGPGRSDSLFVGVGLICLLPGLLAPVDINFGLIANRSEHIYLHDEIKNMVRFCFVFPATGAMTSLYLLSIVIDDSSNA